MIITKRGYIVLAIFSALAIWGMIEVSTHLWWVGGSYCWGSADQCMGTL